MQRHRGFTLFELLVVIVVALALIGMLLTWLQAFRDRARRDGCSVRLKSLVISLHNYHDVHNMLPAGANAFGRTGERSHRISAFPSLIPYIESSHWYDRYLSEHVGDDPWDARPGGIWSWGPAWNFRCVNDPNAVTPNGEIFRTSYRVNLGDWPDRADQVDMPNPRGAFSLLRDVHRSFDDIIDGTQHTIAFSEAATGDKDGHLRGGLTISVPGIPSTGENPEVDFAPESCRNLKDETSRLPGETTLPVIGLRWGDADAVFTGFSTILPPNMPSCSSAKTGDEIDRESETGTDGTPKANIANLVSATSYHQGGVNAAMLDGSVRFVNEAIDSVTAGKTPKGSCVTSGPSPYGVWGMLGAINDSSQQPQSSMANGL